MNAPRVVDSSAWIEWLVASELGLKFSDEIPAKRQCIVPTIVQLELAKWLGRHGARAGSNHAASGVNVMATPFMQ